MYRVTFGLSDSFGGNTAYEYDGVDRLTRVITPQADLFETNYDLAGRTLGRVMIMGVLIHLLSSMTALTAPSI